MEEKYLDAPAASALPGICGCAADAAMKAAQIERHVSAADRKGECIRSKITFATKSRSNYSRYSFPRDSYGLLQTVIYSEQNRMDMLILESSSVVVRVLSLLCFFSCCCFVCVCVCVFVEQPPRPGALQYTVVGIPTSRGRLQNFTP